MSHVSAVDLARAADAAAAGGPAVACVTLLGEDTRRLLLFEGGRSEGTLGDPALDLAAAALAAAALDGDAAAAHEVDAGGATCRLFVEAIHPPDELVIVGAGHIAVPLAGLGEMLNFRVIVLDDRDGFAEPSRFPGAARVHRMDFADPFREVRIGPRSHVVLVTRAHKYDFDCVRRLLDSDVAPKYIGMVGSRRRIRAAFGALLASGVPRERVALVHAPIGIDIGAETPEEIAVSIGAELVQVRRATGASAAAEPAAPLSTKERVLERLLPERRKPAAGARPKG